MTGWTFTLSTALNILPPWEMHWKRNKQNFVHFSRKLVSSSSLRSPDGKAVDVAAALVIWEPNFLVSLPDARNTFFTQEEMVFLAIDVCGFVIGMGSCFFCVFFLTFYLHDWSCFALTFFLHICPQTLDRTNIPILLIGIHLDRTQWFSSLIMI